MPMQFNYSRRHLSAGEARLERILEILPGAVSWSIIIGFSVLSFVKPQFAAALMIAFMLYWVLRLIYMNIFLVASYVRRHIEEGTDWMERIGGIDRLDTYLGELCERAPGRDLKTKISMRIHCRQLMDLKKAGSAPPRSDDICHLVIIPVVREPREIVEPGIIAAREGTFPSRRILIVIALEEIAPEEIKKDAHELSRKHKDAFLDFLVVVHPKNREGEARVKGANATYAAREAARYFEGRKTPPENIIVSCFDADTVPQRDYFSCLTYAYLVTPERTRRSYQPIPVYHNNIWEVPGFARIIDIGTSFFELIEATNPKKLVTFSSHSMSFKTLIDVGFWPVDMVSDDSAIFWKAFIRYDGRYQTIPIYTRVSMDIAVGRNARETFRAIYGQKRRWAWGIENFPIVMRAFLKSKTISLYNRLTYGYKMFDTFISWSTWSFLLALVSWLPAVFANREFATSTVYYTAPRIRSIIFGLASIGIIVCMIISIMMLPRGRKERGIVRTLLHVREWLSIPVIILVFSAIPALDAQTRLMTARYMEFGVTEKYRRKNAQPVEKSQ